VAAEQVEALVVAAEQVELNEWQIEVIYSLKYKQEAR